MVFQKRKYTLKLHLSFCYISYVLKMISFCLKEEKRSLDADWSRAWCRFLLFFTAPHCNLFHMDQSWKSRKILRFSFKTENFSCFFNLINLGNHGKFSVFSDFSPIYFSVFYFVTLRFYFKVRDF